MTPEKRMEIEVALNSVKMHQDELWEALTELEHLLDDKVELDANTDYSGYDVDTLLEMAEKAERPDVLAIFEMAPTGVDDALEATGIVNHFCSEDCRATFASTLAMPITLSTSSDFIEGTVCDQCGKEID